MTGAARRRIVLSECEYQEATLRPHADGWRIDGIEGPVAQAVVRSRSAIVLREPGHTYNSSGIRGLPDRRYAPARTTVWTILESYPDGSLRCQAVIGWSAKPGGKS